MSLVLALYIYTHSTGQRRTKPLNINIGVSTIQATEALASVKNSFNFENVTYF